MAELEFRCICPKKPLLALCGRDSLGRLYVHLKAEKSVGHGQRRIFAEMIATSGTVHLRCRDCLRWHRVLIDYERVDFTPQKLPREITL